VIGVAFLANRSALGNVFHHDPFCQAREMFFRQGMQWCKILQELNGQHWAKVAG
jgi:hypothetical protein